MKRKSLSLAILTLLLASCGLVDKFKTQPDSSSGSENIPTEMSSVDKPVAEGDEFEMLTYEEGTKAPEDQVEAMPANTPMTGEIPPETFGEEPTAPKPQITSSEMEVDNSPRKIKIYKVKKGETLMQIAFKLYGDISKWQDLKKLNREKVSRNETLATNMSIKYEAPETEFVWNPIGEPYMIGHGETLGVISNNVYQTPKKWKAIWENNKPLIRNPNVIYAGFTLYYKKDEKLANYVQPKKEVVEKVKTEPTDAVTEFIKSEPEATESAVRDTASDDIENF